MKDARLAARLDALLEQVDAVGPRGQADDAHPAARPRLGLDDVEQAVEERLARIAFGPQIELVEDEDDRARGRLGLLPRLEDGEEG